MFASTNKQRTETNSIDRHLKITFKLSKAF